MLLIFDNQCSFRLAQGLNLLEDGNDSSPIRCQAKHISEFIAGNSDDDVVIEEAGKHNAIIITYDRDFKELKQKAHLYKQHNVGVVYFRSYKNVLRYWDLVKDFINQWERLKKTLAESEPPFFYEITSKGISWRDV